MNLVKYFIQLQILSKEIIKICYNKQGVIPFKKKKVRCYQILQLFNKKIVRKFSDNFIKQNFNTRTSGDDFAFEVVSSPYHLSGHWLES